MKNGVRYYALKAVHNYQLALLITRKPKNKVTMNYYVLFKNSI